MTKAALLLAALLAPLAACAADTEDHFVLDYEERTLGVGLAYQFMPMRIVCGPKEVFPYSCKQRRATIDEVTATGAGEVTDQLADLFTVHAHRPGTAIVDIRATVPDDQDVGVLRVAETFEVPVLPIAYSQIGWYASDTITEPTGATFRGSTVSVWQHHYREPRERLVGALTSTIVAAELDGQAPFKLDAGTTSAALVLDDGQARLAAEIETGDSVGTVTVHTTAGGAFTLDIVDESAIARLEIYQPRGPLESVIVRPFDAADRPIHGCPSDATLTLTDTANALVVTEVRETPWTQFCEVGLEWKQAPTDTKLVVQWGGREALLRIEN